VEEELEELKRARGRRAVAEEMGDVLFAVVNLARYEGLQAEDLLNRAVAKFTRRFQQVERAIHRRGKRLEDCTLAELDAAWEAAKRPARARPKSAPRRSGN
jgi:Protein containing tetrapyrrole methyltransferase domain and MazG-like (predicted pyrophosphatase) domain